jgi:signal transduction histidine kinase
METTLYRIGQEALTNVARHASASLASLVLERRAGVVTLILEDDGQGFDVASQLTGGRDGRSLGIFGMRERATLLGGTLTIESTPGAGTTVFVELPLPTERTDDPTSPNPYPPDR